MSSDVSTGASRRLLPLPLVLCIGALALSGVEVWAQSSGGSFVLRKHVIAGGGAQSSGANTDVTATAAQVVPGVTSGGSFRATLGFHPAASGGALPLFRDGFE